MLTITSRENKIYKRIKALKEKKQRDKEGIFLVEGIRGVSDAVKNGLSPETVILVDGFTGEAPRCENTFIFAKRLFAEVADTQTPQGIIALFPMPESDFADLKNSDNSFVIVCENVQDPGNLGTIVRTAHCAGAAGVVLTKGCCDLFNPKTVRSTVASIAAIPVIRGIEAADALNMLSSMGYKTVVGALTDKSVSLYEADLSGRTAFIVGNEGAGVTDETVAAADIVVKIPMSSTAESLNVGIAAAVMMYEKVRLNG